MTDPTEPQGRHPDNPREHLERADGIVIDGVLVHAWPFGQSPGIGVFADVADGAMHAKDNPDDVFVFRSGISTPFGLVVQIGRQDDVVLRTLWLDGEQLLRAVVEAGIAHITGTGLAWQGDGESPALNPDVMIPDTVPDNLEGRPDA